MLNSLPSSLPTRLRLDNKQCQELARGIAWKHLQDLAYASDDSCLMSHLRQEIAEKVNRIVHYGRQVGLKGNASKTQFLRINTSKTHIR